MAVGKYLPEANPGPTEAVAVTIKNLLEGLGGGSQLSHDQLDDVSTDDHHAQSHNVASHSDTTGTGAELNTLTENSMADALHRHSELSASDGTPDQSLIVAADGHITFVGKAHADATPIGLDVLRSAVVGINLDVGQNITVDGTVDGVDIAARDHAESHTVVSHNDTTATGANLNTLVGGGETALHSHVGGDVGEGHIVIFPYFYNTIGQGTWALNYYSQNIFGTGFFNTTFADGDNLTFEVYLAAGTYTLRMIHAKQTNSCILDIDIDAAEVASFDTYADPISYNEIATQTAINVAAAGLKTITIRVDGKNASSSGYVIVVQAIAFWRTA